MINSGRCSSPLIIRGRCPSLQPRLPSGVTSGHLRNPCAMLFAPLFERFASGTPLSVMTRALLENALQPDPLDELFERLAVTQYTRELLFSTVVETMALVACRIYKSPRAVYTEHPDRF